jgi:hypothetical protein
LKLLRQSRQHSLPSAAPSCYLTAIRDQSSRPPNKLYYGDNLAVLRDYIPSQSVDLAKAVNPLGLITKSATDTNQSHFHPKKRREYLAFQFPQTRRIEVEIEKAGAASRSPHANALAALLI